VSFVSHLSCSRCDREHDASVAQNRCVCGSPLLVEYDLERLGRRVDRGAVEGRSPDLWRYRELLPVHAPEAPGLRLGEGFTPLRALRSIGGANGRFWVKDDGLNPTGTFKARGAAVGIARARELGVRDVALATAGNAGGAWACYGAAAGVRVHVAMPRDAPLSNRLECAQYGADLTLVDGLISDAARFLEDRRSVTGWFDASTLREPYRLEGKKTLGFEIAEQLGWRLPSAIVYPAGGGVGLIGIWRGIEQLRRLGWVDRSGPMPRLVVVQAEGCAPIVHAFREGREESKPWEGAKTIAAGLRVPKALGDFLVLRAVRETGGTAVAVSDRSIARAMIHLAREDGLSASPEGAATLAACWELRERGFLAPGEEVVLVNTGTGTKYPEALEWALKQFEYSGMEG
jgi:threonine synthase